MKKSYTTPIVVSIIVIILIGVVLTLRTAKTPVPVVQTPAGPITQTLPQTYSNPTKGITLNYPSGYSYDESYAYQALGPGKDIQGVKFTIPAQLVVGTNLSSDSYISIEQIPGKTTCDASLFVDPASSMKPATVVDNGVSYSMATSSDAGAGNRYDETVYAIGGTNPCVAVRYFVHYAAIENYPAGSVKQFDRQALVDQFDQIRRTLVVKQ